MSTYIVSYDLRKPGRDYSSLYKAIKSYPGWAHLLESTWGISTGDTAVQVRDHLRQKVDASDRLLVVKAAPAWAASGIASNLLDWLKRHVAS